MTAQKSFKRLVRMRMEKTGESYTAARASLLNGSDSPKAAEGPTLTLSEEAITRRTGRGWEEWFDVIDASPVADAPHSEIAEWLMEEREVPGWDAQSITVSYERARRGRAIGERADGFEISATKTVNVPVGRLFDAVVDESLRAAWLPGGRLSERTATKPRSARYDWEDGATRVAFGFEAKGEEKSVVALAHQRLADGGEADRMKAFWRERLAELKSKLEGGEIDA